MRRSSPREENGWGVSSSDYASGCRRVTDVVQGMIIRPTVHNAPLLFSSRLYWVHVLVACYVEEDCGAYSKLVPSFLII